MSKRNTNPAAEAPAEVAEVKHSIEAHRKNCLALYGVTSCTFDGATYGLDGEYTVEEMKQIIAEWQSKEVK